MQVNPILTESFEKYMLIQTLLYRVSDYMCAKMEEPSMFSKLFNLEAAVGRVQYEMLPDSKIMPLSVELQPDPRGARQDPAG